MRRAQAPPKNPKWGAGAPGRRALAGAGIAGPERKRRAGSDAGLDGCGGLAPAALPESADPWPPGGCRKSISLSTCHPQSCGATCVDLPARACPGVRIPSAVVVADAVMLRCRSWEQTRTPRGRAWTCRRPLPQCTGRVHHSTSSWPTGRSRSSMMMTWAAAVLASVETCGITVVADSTDVSRYHCGLLGDMMTY